MDHLEGPLQGPFSGPASSILILQEGLTGAIARTSLPRGPRGDFPKCIYAPYVRPHYGGRCRGRLRHLKQSHAVAWAW